MTVYVDDARNPLGRMLMCHMTADTVAELHRAANEIGLKREWFQDHGNHYHYDCCQQKRGQAIIYGAVEVSQRDMAKLARKLKDEGK